ncbi:hypothetical protein PN498_18180 [Oscillatoria sp. CS-180]|uniref:hypothetical protein n=1 Tax=Oscillatoria sp. CS-180 TaxID=3021720 RepID=UPI00232FE79C|nr:hypothetical protein [Oscillatoria sp. CS-180]MDB9527927.1 hypothetical protein [Oscillatoria sp. CS-180]
MATLENQRLTQGQYEGILLAATTRDPAGVRKKSVYKVEEIEVAMGDRLKWTKNQATLDRCNGQEFEVLSIKDEQVLFAMAAEKRKA